MSDLNERERFIVRERKLRDQPRTLESLGQELKLSKERVRQLEAAASGKCANRLKISRVRFGTSSREGSRFATIGPAVAGATCAGRIRRDGP